MQRVRVGLKLWSTNGSYFDEAVRVIRGGHCQFVELFSVPGSFGETIAVWERLQKETQIEFVVHAPHFVSGLNLSDPSAWPRNRELATEAFRFADVLGCDMVVFHPGVGGRLDETIRQVSLLDDPRFVIENKPKTGLNGEVCVGYAPAEIERILAETRCRFCLDFGHAIYAANAVGTQPLVFIDGFLPLKPDLYHLTDGDFAGRRDVHDRYGHGSFPLPDLIARIPHRAMVTNEAKRGADNRLDDFVDDARVLEGLGDANQPD